MTSLVECFANENSLEKQSSDWFKSLNRYFHQCFKKIRIKNTKKEDETDKQLKQRSELIQRLKKSNDDSKDDILDEIDKIEKKISKLVSECNRKKVIDNFGELKSNDGSANVTGVWAIKRKVFPKNN